MKPGNATDYDATGKKSHRVKVLQAPHELRPAPRPLPWIEEVAPVPQEAAPEARDAAEPRQEFLSSASAAGERPQEEGVAPGDEAVDGVEAVEDDGGPEDRS